MSHLHTKSAELAAIREGLVRVPPSSSTGVNRSGVGVGVGVGGVHGRHLHEGGHSMMHDDQRGEEGDVDVGSSEEDEHPHPSRMKTTTKTTETKRQKRSKTTTTTGADEYIDARDDDDAVDGIHLSGLGISSAVSKGNSRAVLSALKSLQEKIRRLETECSFYKESYEQSKRSAFDVKEDLVVRLKRAEEEFSEEVSTMKEEKTALLSERNELARALSDVKRHMKTLEKELKVIREVSREQEEERNTLKDRVSELSTLLDRRERESGQELEHIETKLRSFEVEGERLRSENGSLHAQLEEERQKREQLLQQNESLEKGIDEILRINEALVERNLEKKGRQKGRVKRSSSQKRTTSKLKKRGMTKKSGAGVGGKKKKKTHQVMMTEEEEEELLMDHARLTSDKWRTHIHQSRHGGGGGKTFQERLRDANGGKDVPFLLGKTSTEESFHKAAAVQKALSLSRISSTAAGDDGKDDSKGKPSGRSVAARGASSLGSSKRSLRSRSTSPKRLSPSIPPPAPGILSPQMRSRLDDGEIDIDEVINDLEAEKKAASNRYHELLEETRSKMDRWGSEDDLASTQEIRWLIEQMERKTDQLAHLKAYRETMSTAVRHFTTPPRVPGARKRERALKLFRDLHDLQSQ
eukprot:TRINITY_DN718_c1_g2_i1.p1 TRINITY_DN718_c1_g2~~TRINITY_DN718_c1_g2_i1.p1  ORF type:complete len:638 (+),score=245.38 TRINITY_DN718_c1_g2_i1:158-2071(+)